MIRKKKAAMELAIGTIIIIVIAVILLIFGIILVRSIMCSGIIMSDQISSGVQKKIADLFGEQKYGVACMGEGGEEIKLGDGGKRPIGCVVREDTSRQYDLKVKEVKSLSGVSTTQVNRWVIDSGWKGTAKVGDTTALVAYLNIPKNTDATLLKIEIEVTVDGQKETHFAYVNVVHVGAFSSAIC